MNKVKVTVNGKTYNVEIENAFVSPMKVIVNGKSYQVDVEREAISPLTAGQTGAVALPTVQPLAAVAPPAVKKMASEHTADAGGSISAPMPGVIVEVYVSPGQAVSAGEQVCVLEAMKMKNIIRSARDGVVAAVHVREGQKVVYNDTLVSFQ